MLLVGFIKFIFKTVRKKLLLHWIPFKKFIDADALSEDQVRHKKNFTQDIKSMSEKKGRGNNRKIFQSNST